MRVATLRLRRVDPWSAMKTGFVFALGLGLMYVVAALLLFLFASAAGGVRIVQQHLLRTQRHRRAVHLRDRQVLSP